MGGYLPKNCQPENLSNARTILNRAIRKPWSRSQAKVDITVLPGGFVFDELPKDASFESGWDSEPEDFQTLTEYGQQALDQVLTANIVAAMSKRTKYLTIGVDLRTRGDIKTNRRTIKNCHVELVAVVKLTSRKSSVVAWTGKSYPTGTQENSLIHVCESKLSLRRNRW